MAVSLRNSRSIGALQIAASVASQMAVSLRNSRSIGASAHCKLLLLWLRRIS
jgi:hypothetical protein